MVADQPSTAENPSDREIVVSRSFAAPRELIWEVWTDPHHIARWWGPKGFTTTIEQMDVRPGGVWKQVMHGPDGTDYPNRSVFTEVVKPERIVFSHGGGRKGGPGVRFESTWTFAALDAGNTRVTIRMVFPSASDRDRVAKEYGAIEGARQTLERLEELVTRGLVVAERPAVPGQRPFVITRVFDAPRDLVWKAWTERGHLRRWFGPKGVTMAACTLDFRPGGIFHYCMNTPDGHEMWGKWTFREIVPPARLVLISSFSDAHGGVTRHPLSPTWPRETLSITTLTEHEGKTTLTLRWEPYNATEQERRTFDSSHGGMTQGWTGTMEQLTAYLAEIKSTT